MKSTITLFSNLIFLLPLCRYNSEVAFTRSCVRDGSGTAAWNDPMGESLEIPGCSYADEDVKELKDLSKVELFAGNSLEY